MTYQANIAPILDQQCASCHRPITGDPNDPLCVGGAPFSLLDYKTVKSHAKRIFLKLTVQSRAQAVYRASMLELI